MNIGDMMMTRDGRAEVVAIDGRAMTLRLPNGSQVVIRQPAPAKSSGSRRPRMPKSHFQGFHRDDFKDNVTGTSWRSRAQLGGEVTARLGEGVYNSYPVYRVPVVHWAREDRWEPGREAHHAKLFSQLSSEGMRCGFYIERQPNEHPLSKDWERFSHWIASDNAHAFIHRLIPASGISLRVLVGQLTIPIHATDEGWHAAMGEKAIAIPREKIGDFLTEEMPSEWLGLYIEKALSVEEAMDMGSTVATAIADTLKMLVPVYDAATSGRAEKEQ